MNPKPIPFLRDKPKKGHAWAEKRYAYDAAPARPARGEGEG